MADALDVDYRRAQRNDHGKFFEELTLPAGSVPHWKGLRAIPAVRIKANGGMAFELFIDNFQEARFQIDELKKELKCFAEFQNAELRIIGEQGVVDVSHFNA